MQIHNSIEMRFNAFIKMIPLVSGLVHRIQSLTRGNRQNVGGGVDSPDSEMGEI